jgi:hypothetical protein
MPAQNDPTYFKLSDVLRKEFEELRPSELGPGFAGPSSASTEPDKRREMYNMALDELRLSALHCQGGGIRSACVAIGVIQSLAEAKPIIFERSNAMQTFWNFQIIVIFGLLGFITTARATACQESVKVMLTVGHVMFALVNLEALIFP